MGLLRGRARAPSCSSEERRCVRHWSRCRSTTAGPPVAQIKLALSMVRHTSPDADYQGVILVNPGGPGVSGLALSTIGKRVPNGVGTEYDWVGFDPRGVGASVPALHLRANYVSGPRPTYITTTSAAAARLVAPGRGLRGGLRQAGRRPARPRHDRRQRPTTWTPSGRRCGRTRSATTATPTAPTSARSTPRSSRPTSAGMVLDSNVDPRTVWYQANLDQDVDVQAEHEDLVRLARPQQRDVPAGPTEAAVEHRFYQAQAYFDGPSDRRGRRRRVERRLRHRGLLAGLLERPRPRRSAPGSSSGTAPSSTASYRFVDTPGEDNTRAMYNAVECTDAPWPRSVAKSLADTRRPTPRRRTSTWQNMWFNAPCLTWPAAAHTPVTINGSAGAARRSWSTRRWTRRRRTPAASRCARSSRRLGCSRCPVARHMPTRCPATPARTPPSRGTSRPVPCRRARPANTADATCAPRPQPPPTQ